MTSANQAQPALPAPPLVMGWLNRIVRHFGWVLIPTREIETMSRDGSEYYTVMSRDGISERNSGYFNGLADYASKKAHQLRRYVPNGRMSDGAERRSSPSDGSASESCEKPNKTA